MEYRVSTSVLRFGKYYIATRKTIVNEWTGWMIETTNDEIISSVSDLSSWNANRTETWTFYGMNIFGGDEGEQIEGESESESERE